MGKPTISGLPSSILVTSAQLKVGGVDVGLVSNVSIKIKEETTEVMSDQTGKMPLNDFYIGHVASGECEFDEFTAVKMKKAFPQALLVVDGDAARLSFGKQIGYDYRSIAAEFLVIATSDETTVLTRRFRFWLGVFIGDADVKYGPNGKLTFKAKMKFYPDTTKTPGEWLGDMGDPTAGSLVASYADAAVAGGGNTGGGTVGSISTNDTFTKNETWTLTCIKAVAAGGIFSVTGSVTGARGNATVGSAYHSNIISPSNSEINFTVNDGSPDFAVGDSFTIVTHEAEYT